MGTLPYTSPEQLRGEKVDTRTDIFAFGALLYEMLAGTRPFTADSQAGLIAAVLEHDAPPVSDASAADAGQPRSHRAEVPGQESGRSVADRARFEERTGLGARRARGRPPRATVRRASRRDGVNGGSCSRSAIPTLARWRSRSRCGACRPATGASAHGHAPVAQSAAGGHALHPDQWHLDRDRSRRKPDRVHRCPTAARRRSSSTRWPRARRSRYPDTRAAVTPMFSPDSQWVAFGEAGTIKKVPADGGPVQVVGTGGAGAMTWLSDGRIVRGSASGEWLGHPGIGARAGRADDSGRRRGRPSHPRGVTGWLAAVHRAAGRPAEHVEQHQRLAAGRDGGAGADPARVQPATAWTRCDRLCAGPRTLRRRVRQPRDPPDQRAARDGHPGADDVISRRRRCTPYADNGTLVYAEPPGGRRLVWVDRDGREESSRPTSGCTRTSVCLPTGPACGRHACWTTTAISR